MGFRSPQERELVADAPLVQKLSSLQRFPTQVLSRGPHDAHCRQVGEMGTVVIGKVRAVTKKVICRRTG